MKRIILLIAINFVITKSIFSQSSFTIQQDSFPVYLQLHLVGSPFFYSNFNKTIFNPGILVSATKGKVEFATGLFFDFHTFYFINQHRIALVSQQDTSRFSYLIFPVFLRYYLFNEKLVSYLSIGTFLKGQTQKNGKVLYSDIEYVKEYDFPIQIGLGAVYSFSGKTKIYLEPFIRGVISKNALSDELETPHLFPGLLIGISYNFLSIY
ncbi:MAG: hypothetical protein ABIT08_09320 [Bacteroidia bacterium]